MIARLRELAIVLFVGTSAAIVMTWPLAIEMGRIGRVDTADGQLSIWNVAWVARTLVVDPLHVFDANIFYPHTHTLAYSESNLGAGAVAIPAYWLTRNAFTAHNFAVLVAFALAAACTYYLVRYLVCDRPAAMVSAVCFAFTPFVFAHTAHIQLLMTFGLPLTMLMFHRFADSPTKARGAALGATMALTAVFCGYYGVYVVLMVGYAAIVVATTRRRWGSWEYWGSLAVGALVSITLIVPVFLPYWGLQRVQGFRRQLEDARLYSASWSDYLASASPAHAWMLPRLPPWTDVSFPGFVALTFGVAGMWAARKLHRRELLAIYGGLGVLALWASFGPAAGLYTILYDGVPLFAWLRAPARFGLVVALALAVLTGAGVSMFVRRFRRPTLAAIAVAVVAITELHVSSNLRDVPPFDPVYRTLATLPRAPVIELPFYYLRGMFPLHTSYMLSSTTHWMPLVNGYSDYIPQDFFDNVMTLAPFPTPPAMKLIEPWNVRYAIFHMGGYNDSNRHDTEVRLKQLENYFRPLYVSDSTRLYEIVGFPSDAQAEIESAYARADSAYVAAKTLADLEAIREWLDTPDCVYADYDQPPRRWSEMRGYAVQGLQTTLVKFQSTIQRLDLHGDTAVATVLVEGIARVTDREGHLGATGSTHEIETTATVRDEWLKTDRWRRQSHLKIVANHVTAIDGRRAIQ